MKIPQFVRKEWTTKCSDPTVVVQYENKELGITITEFQGIYQTTLRDGLYGDKVTAMGMALHDALEEVHNLRYQIECMSQTDEQSEIEDAERRAGWDPNP